MNNHYYYLKIDGRVQKFFYPYDPKGTNDVWGAIPSSQFLSVDEITENEFSIISSDADSLREWKKIKTEDLILTHHFYGQFIRNSYGLWHHNNPFVIPGDLGDGHPDGLSMKVIEKLHARCNNPYSAYDNAMSII